MKRVFTLSATFIIAALMAILAIPQLSVANCFRNGALPYSHAEAGAEIAERLFRGSESAWVSLGIEKIDLLNAIDVLEVNGPQMTFDHHSTRYVKFELSICPAIEKPISNVFFCGHPNDLGGIVRRCHSNSQ